MFCVNKSKQYKEHEINVFKLLFLRPLRLFVWLFDSFYFIFVLFYLFIYLFIYLLIYLFIYLFIFVFLFHFSLFLAEIFEKRLPVKFTFHFVCRTQIDTSINSGWIGSSKTS